jgi:hypothetical protein
MSKSPQAKANFAARLQQRIRRDKAATTIFAALIGTAGNRLPEKTAVAIAEEAVAAADILLAELDRTRTDDAPPPA